MKSKILALAIILASSAAALIYAQGVAAQGATDSTGAATTNAETNATVNAVAPAAGTMQQ